MEYIDKELDYTNICYDDDFYYISSFHNNLYYLYEDICLELYKSRYKNENIKNVLPKLLLLIPYMDRFSCNTIECVFINYYSFLCEIEDKLSDNTFLEIIDTLFFFINKSETLSFRGKDILERYLHIRRNDYKTKEEYLNAFNQKYYETKIRMIIKNSLHNINKVNKTLIDLIISFRINEPSCMLDLIYYIIQNFNDFNYDEYCFILDALLYILKSIEFYFRSTPDFIYYLNKINRRFGLLAYIDD